MTSQTVAVLVVVVLGAWQLRIRRHPAWSVSAPARHHLDTACLLVVIAAYWLTDAPTTLGWEWVVGNLWLLAAVTSMALGLRALADTTLRQALMSAAIESIGERGSQPPTSHRVSRRPVADA